MNKKISTNKIKTAQEVFSDLSTELQSVIEAAQTDLKTIKGFDKDDPLLEFKMLLVLFLHKAIALCQTLKITLQNNLNLWREATAMLRTLLELCVNAAYIKKAPQELSARFLRYHEVWQYKFRNEISKLSVDIKQIFDKNIEKNELLESEFKKFKKDYNSTKTWSGKIFKDMLKDVYTKNTWLYYYIYKTLCNYVHISSLSLEEYFHELENGCAIYIDAKPEDIDRTLIITIVLFTSHYDICDKVLGFKKSQWIETFLKKLADRRKIVIKDES